MNGTEIPRRKKYVVEVKKKMKKNEECDFLY